MKKYKYPIHNIDCASCAREIEEGLNKDKRLAHVVVNFSTSKLSYEAEEELSIKELNHLIGKIEDGVTVSKEEIEEKKEYHLLTLAIGFCLGLLGTLGDFSYDVQEACILVSYLLLLYRPFISAVTMLWKSRTINENMLITISCIGAYVIGENLEGIMVISLYVLGKILEEKAVNNTRTSIQKLMDLKENYAYRKEGGKVVKIPVEEVVEGDTLVIKKGDKVPVDGIVVKGSSSLDTSMLTGETEPLKVEKNQEVLSGCINKEEVLEIKAMTKYEDSTVARVLSLLEDATDQKAHTETEVSKLSKVYTPIILVLSVVVAIFLPMISSLNYSESIYRALTFLVISCPCAIAISVPLSYFTGIGVSSKNGILVKGSNYLDLLSHVRKIVFDKTGTLTTGSFQVTNIEVLDSNYTKEKVIELLAKAEAQSLHPIAKSILALVDGKVDIHDVKDYRELSGKGISYTLGKDKIRVGNQVLCDCEEEAVLHLNVNHHHVASISIDDGIKDSAKNSIQELKELGVTSYMFTGDKKENAVEIGKRLGIENVEYEMLPTDKYQRYEKLKQDNSIVAFVGDGINDAPTLKRADIGISMGNLGSSSAIEASDIVLMKDDLSKIPLAIRISKYTNRIIKENLIFAISVKVAILLLSVFGYATMWFAVFADTGVTLLTILNTLRIFYRYRKEK